MRSTPRDTRSAACRDDLQGPCINSLHLNPPAAAAAEGLRTRSCLLEILSMPVEEDFETGERLEAGGGQTCQHSPQITRQPT